MWNRVYSDFTGRINTIVGFRVGFGPDPLNEIVSLMLMLLDRNRPNLAVGRDTSQHFLNTIL